MKPTVCILMSTYNGEKYIRQQLESIFAQQDVDIKLVIRDDGSSDDTVKIIKEFESVELIQATNVGCEGSFMELLQLPIEADYYAFADQDDVWMPRKIISAIDNMKFYKCDLSVCNLMLVDAELNELGPLFSDRKICFYQRRMDKYIISNFHGCVQVWSNKLHKIIQTYKPKDIHPHDVWVNAIANLVSKTYIDKNCYIKYRLHGNNVSGYATNTIDRIKKGLKLYLFKDHPSCSNLSKQLLDNFSEFIKLEDNRIHTLNVLATYTCNFKNKVKLFFSNFIQDNSFQYRILYRLCILLNRF